MSTTTTCRVHSSVIRGVEAWPVEVAVAIDHDGVPGMSIEGVAEADALEMRSRVRCAMRSCGYEVPRAGIRISVEPVGVRKPGAGLDLPVAAAVLAASGQIPTAGLDGCMLVGGLDLEGHVHPVRGALAYSDSAEKSGRSLVFGNGAWDLGLLRHGADALPRFETDAPETEAQRLDFADIEGCAAAKRALAVGAVAGAGVLLVGDEAACAMLARRAAGIMPEDGKLAHEAAVVCSVAGEPMDGGRPFRAPHSTISVAGLVGGGRPVAPGEASLAHGGVLYIGGVDEWPARTLRCLRAPMEEGFVRIVRADGAYTFPVRFRLVASTGSEHANESLGGPVSGLIGVRAAVETGDGETQSTAELHAMVERGLAFAAGRARVRGAAGAGEPPSMDDMTDAARAAYLGALRARQADGRGARALYRIARAIADMGAREQVELASVLEAVGLWNA